MASAALFGVAIAPSAWWSLGAFVLAPWFLVALRGGPVGAALGSFLVGIAYGCSVGGWIPSALDGLGASSAHGLLGLLASAVWIKGLPFALLGLALHGLRRARPALLVLAAGTGFFALETIASTWRWGVPWALLGHSQARVPGVAQLALVAGVPLISALLAAINMAGALAWRHRGRSGSAALLLSTLVAWGTSAALGLPVAQALRPAPGGDEVALVIAQPNIPRGERWADDRQRLHLRRIGEYTARVLAESRARPDAILWPENLLTTPVDTHAALAADLLAWVDRLAVPVILGAARSAPSGDPQRYRSSVLWVSPGAGGIASLDKARGVPVLESAAETRVSRWLGRAFGRAATWKKVEEMPRGGSLVGPFTVTPLLCYEALLPRLAARSRTAESVALLNLADDSWAEDPRATEQLVSFASFRAIEQRLPLVRVAHGGLSVVLDEYGRVVRRLPLDAYASATVRLRPLPPPTLGERFALLALPLLAGGGVWWSLARRSRA